jgi:hypothetical protein
MQGVEVEDHIMVPVAPAAPEAVVQDQQGNMLTLLLDKQIPAVGVAGSRDIQDKHLAPLVDRA